MKSNASTQTYFDVIISGSANRAAANTTSAAESIQRAVQHTERLLLYELGCGRPLAADASLLADPVLQATAHVDPSLNGADPMLPDTSAESRHIRLRLAAVVGHAMRRLHHEIGSQLEGLTSAPPPASATEAPLRLSARAHYEANDLGVVPSPRSTHRHSPITALPPNVAKYAALLGRTDGDAVSSPRARSPEHHLDHGPRTAIRRGDADAVPVPALLPTRFTTARAQRYAAQYAHLIRQ